MSKFIIDYFQRLDCQKSCQMREHTLPPHILSDNDVVNRQQQAAPALTEPLMPNFGGCLSASFISPLLTPDKSFFFSSPQGFISAMRLQVRKNPLKLGSNGCRRAV